MTSQNVALWNINIALWVTFLFIVTKIFHLWKMTYLTFNCRNSVMSWNFCMRFSAKWFALAALSVYYNYTEIVKTLSFDLFKSWFTSSNWKNNAILNKRINFAPGVKMAWTVQLKLSTKFDSSVFNNILHLNDCLSQMPMSRFKYVWSVLDCISQIVFIDYNCNISSPT